MGKRLSTRLSLPVALTATMFALLLMVPVTAVAAPAGWTVQPTTAPAGSIPKLASVSCPTSSFCLAVGSDENTAALYATSDGRTWSPEHELLPAGAETAELSSVSCTGVSQCVAVGDYVDSSGVRDPLAEHWDGSRWTQKTVPVGISGSVNGLSGVDCVTSVSCFAVGSVDAGPIADHWNGTAWSSQAVAAGTIRGELDSVSCGSGSSCVAVGSYPDASGHQQPSAATLSGSTWTLRTVPAAAGADASALLSVSCATAGDCLAVGYANTGTAQRPFTTKWDGSSWVEQPVPVLAGSLSAQLDGVSCVSPIACTGVGQAEISIGSYVALADRWNGSVWVVEPVNTSPLPPQTYTYAVSCPTAQYCSAVGIEQTDSGAQSTLAESWGGLAWAELSIPSPATMKFAQLFGTSCPSVNSCVAVGQFDRTSDGTLVAFGEAWNGSSWRLLPRVPLPTGAGNATLLGVSCPLADQCVAVGSYTRVSDSRVIPLMESWNGRAWTVVSAGIAIGAYAQLDAVWCKSMSSCQTVGFSIPSAASGVSVPLAESLADTTTIVARLPALPQNTGSALHGVSCDVNLNCVAVGNWDEGHGEMPLSYRESGEDWTMMHNPSGGDSADPGEDDLFGVSCVTFSSCLAVGVLQTTAETPLAQSLSTTTWSDVSPDSPRQGAFHAVSCPAANACAAVGYRTTSSQTLTLAVRWNGSSWSTQPTPNPGNDDILYGTSCPTLNACLAVGTAADQHTTLAEIYS